MTPSGKQVPCQLEEDVQRPLRFGPPSCEGGKTSGLSPAVSDFGIRVCFGFGEPAFGSPPAECGLRFAPVLLTLSRMGTTTNDTGAAGSGAPRLLRDLGPLMAMAVVV